MTENNSYQTNPVYFELTGSAAKAVYLVNGLPIHLLVTTAFSLDPLSSHNERVNSI